MARQKDRAPRRYRAPLREDGALRTRRLITKTAKETFEKHGWSGATVSMIAERAGVSQSTVEAVFRTKPALLKAAVDYAIRGDIDPLPIRGREISTQMEAAPDAVSMLELHAGHLRAVHGRSAGLAFVVEQAAKSDGGVAALWRQMNKNRRDGVEWAATQASARRSTKSGFSSTTCACSRSSGAQSAVDTRRLVVRSTRAQHLRPRAHRSLPSPARGARPRHRCHQKRQDGAPAPQARRDRPQDRSLGQSDRSWRRPQPRPRPHSRPEDRTCPDRRRARCPPTHAAERLDQPARGPREILNALPDLGEALTTADTETRRGVFDAFRLSVALDRNAHQIQVKALVSSAFTKTRDLQSLVTNEAIAGAGFEPATSGL